MNDTCYATPFVRTVVDHVGHGKQWTKHVADLRAELHKCACSLPATSRFLESDRSQPRSRTWDSLLGTSCPVRSVCYVCAAPGVCVCVCGFCALRVCMRILCGFCVRCVGVCDGDVVVAFSLWLHLVCCVLDRSVCVHWFESGWTHRHTHTHTDTQPTQKHAHFKHKKRPETALHKWVTEKRTREGTGQWRKP